MQFAKTIALGAAIGDFLFRSVERPATQALVHILPPEYHKWIPTAIGYACKSVAISVAWKVQAILSAFHSAIRGGLMASRGAIAWLNRRGITRINTDDSLVDEVLGWTLAAAGFYFQFKLGFTPPWLMSLLLWPLDVAETYIAWSISSTPGVPEA